jgi:predicted nuclease of predicted toxin-antitoxin system
LRILLDENVPAILARALPGHDVQTVQRMRWAGIKNGELLDRAAREFQVLLTIDQSIEHQQSLPSGLSMIVLLLPDNKPDTVLAVAEEGSEPDRKHPAGSNLANSIAN